MTPEYKTVFEVSYLSNGILFFSAFALFVGIFAGGVATVVYGRMPISEAKAVQEKFFYFRLVVVIWIGISTVWFISNIFQAHKLIHALRSGSCGVVEGAVRVLDRQPWIDYRRHADCIQVADKTFSYSSHALTFGYQGGGLTTDGVTVRIHYLGGTILKAEIK